MCSKFNQWHFLSYSSLTLMQYFSAPRGFNLVLLRTTAHKTFPNLPQQTFCRGDLSPGWKGHMLSGVTRRNVLCSVWLCKSLFRLKHTSAIQACIHALMLAANGPNNSVHLSDFFHTSWCWQFLWRSLKNSNDLLETRRCVCASLGIRRAEDSSCTKVQSKHSFRFSGLKWLWFYDRFY